MTTLAFPTSKIAPVEDQTERHWNTVAGIAGDFERAAEQAADPGRCFQLHARIESCLQTLIEADRAISKKWDAILFGKKD